MLPSPIPVMRVEALTGGAPAEPGPDCAQRSGRDQEHCGSTDFLKARFHWRAGFQPAMGLRPPNVHAGKMPARPGDQRLRVRPGSARLAKRAARVRTAVRRSARPLPDPPSSYSIGLIWLPTNRTMM